MNRIDFPPPVGGNSRQANWLNRLRRAAMANRHLMSVGSRLTETPNGTFRVSTDREGGGGEGGTKIARFRILVVAGDILGCDPYDDEGLPTNAEVLTTIARPLLLRGDTRTVTVVAGSPPGTISESVQPPYENGKDIFAVNDPDGLTGITGVTWMDLNVDGRHWRAEYRAVCVKINGVSRQMIVAGGPPFD